MGVTHKDRPDDYDERQRDELEYLNYTSATRNDILPIPKIADIRLHSRPAPALKNVSTGNTGNLIIYSVIGLAICGIIAGWLAKRIKPTGG